MRNRLFVAALLLVGLASVPSPAGSTAAVRVEALARAFHPGEPVRVVLLVDEPIESVRGSFLGRELHLVREGSDGSGGERWSGWSMISLDEQPGTAAIEIAGEAKSGRTVVGTRAVRIEARSFPSETLSVAPKFVEPPPAVQERLVAERSKLAKVYSSRRELPPPDRVFVRPVPGDATSVFGTRRLYNGKPRSPHPGLDLRAGSGTPVISSGAGWVGLAQDLYYSGNTVIVDHGGGLFTIYAHLSEILVDEGDEVESSQLLGRSGATGRVTGPHLHWGAKIGDSPFDPAALLDAALFGGPAEGSERQ